MGRDNPTLGRAILAQVRGVKSRIGLRPSDFVKDFTSLPHAPRPGGAVALDFACGAHTGRLMRLWMSPQAGFVTFGGEGREGAWDNDTNGCGAVLLRCTRHGCHNSARLTNDWLVARLAKVRSDFETGKGLPIAWFSLTRVGISAG
jgi:hypothetical protein